MKTLIQGIWERGQTLRRQHDMVVQAAQLDTVRRLPWILATAMAALLIGALAPAAFTGINVASWINLAMFGWLLIVGVLLRWIDFARRGALPVLLLATSCLLFACVRSVVDQWGSASVTMFSLGCMFAGTLVLIRPAHAIALYLGSFAAFYVALGYTQNNPVVLQVNRAQGFGAVILALLMAVVLWRKHTVATLLQRQLEASNEELRRQQLELEILSQRDALTGLFNRREFTRLANLELQSTSRHESHTALIMADLDLFKHVNDTYGHPFGDEVIQFMANTLSNGVRATDVVARMGGEEFAVLLPKTSLAAAILLAEKLRALVGLKPAPNLANSALYNQCRPLRKGAKCASNGLDRSTSPPEMTSALPARKAASSIPYRSIEPASAVFPVANSPGSNPRCARVATHGQRPCRSR